MDDLLQEFIAETRETLAAIAGEVVAWEADPSDRGRLDAIFRFVHTVKGSCGFLDLPRLERLSHAAEDVLAAVRAGERMADANLVTAVLSVVDRIGELAEAIETGVSLPDEEDARLIAALAPGGGAAPALPPEEAPPPPVANGPRGVARSIRLPIDLLDRMMGGVSDMVLARNELSRKLREAGCGSSVDAAFERLSVSVAEMRDAITRTRMQRIDTVFSTLPRMVRDLSAELHKLVMLEVDGGDVELDREMIEMIRDPLTHIIRNAIDHGIESPDERRAAGKSAAGRLAVSARQAGNQILIEVVDDGRGIDAERLVQKALAAGILSPERADALSWTQKLALIFEPGLSTAQAISAISGRGVGMDVVKSNVERIGGLVDVESRPRQGLRLTLRVPLTLTIIPALTISAGGQHFAIPRPAIEEIVRRAGDGVRCEGVGGGCLAHIRTRRMPVVSLAGVTRTCGAEEGAILIVLKPAGGDTFALAVDAVHDHEELVVKPAAPAVMAAGIYAGTTLPDNGRPMLLLDPAGIAAVAGLLGGEATPDLLERDADEEEERRVPTLLFHDVDGVERAIRLAVVERIVDVPPQDVRFSAGQLRLSQEGRIVPLLSVAPEQVRARLGAALRVLRMSDGAVQLAYAIDAVIDIADLPVAAQAVADGGGPVAGVVLFDGRQIELIEPYWLFAEAAATPSPAAVSAKPLCLLAAAEDGWTREILRPLVEAAGYRVAIAGADNARPDLLPDVVIESAGAPAPAIAPGVPVLRLRAAPEPARGEEDSVYRYDRAGLLAALGARARSR